MSLTYLISSGASQLAAAAAAAATTTTTTTTTHNNTNTYNNDDSTTIPVLYTNYYTNYHTCTIYYIPATIDILILLYATGFYTPPPINVYSVCLK